MEELISLGRELENAAEPGFLEHRTHQILAARFRGRGFVIQEFHGMPGFSATADGLADGKTVAILADMDGLPPTAGSAAYAHLCGHHQQMVALFAAACVLQERAAHLLQRVAFVAVPAEEYVDLDRREALRRTGAVHWLSGKQELIERGFFKGIRAVLASHSASLGNPLSVNSVVAMNGFEALQFAFRGQSAHAGAAPHLGRNAQNAACLFVQACAFLREGFEEGKHIRIHPVLRMKPEQAVNLIPDTAMVETYARAADAPAVQEIVQRLTAAAAGCANALGVEFETRMLRGYAPFRVDPALHHALRRTAQRMGIEFIEDGFSAASSDMGDLSVLLPSIIVGLPGTNGRLHQPEFRVIDETAAYVFPGEVLAELAIDVLAEAER
jgi:amidohydrolase